MAKRIKVALNFPRSPGKALVYAKHILACMTGNAYFPSPTLPLATLAAHIADLDAAEVTAGTGAYGTATERDAKLAIVKGDLQQLRMYVETIAQQYPLDEAKAVVVSSGMSVKQVAGPDKAPAAVKQGKTSGSVRLDVRHPAPKTVTTFHWQWSTDGLHWFDAPPTAEAKTTITDLTPGTWYFFRYSTFSRNGMSDWSDPLKFLVG